MCAAEVPSSISSPVDKKLWHAAQQSYNTATSQKANQPKYLTQLRAGFNATHESFFRKLHVTRQLPRLTGLAMASNVNFTFAGMLLDTHSSLTIVLPAPTVSYVLTIALCSSTVLMALHKVINEALGCPAVTQF